jgi:2-polyprenyl-3-methyl-5-hydroxy-6-metoxy-1,4-benzoquinol methylase
MDSKELLRQIHHKWWIGYRAKELTEPILRHAFHLDLVLRHKTENMTVCDLGGGWGAFASAVAASGMKSMLIDDFKDSGFFTHDDPRHQMSSYYGFTKINRDIVKDGIDFESESIDVFTCFDSMEHWHSSPKRLFHQCMNALRPGGLFILGVPNCVNLRKRITVPLGRGKWSSIADWYESPIFRGHVREPDIDDLRYLARDMKLLSVQMIGRNWQGYAANLVIAALTRLLDHPLRIFPSLCSDIYLVGRKAQ